MYADGDRERLSETTVATTLTRYSLEIAQLSETVPRRRRTSGLNFASLPGAQFTVFAQSSSSPSATPTSSPARRKPPKKGENSSASPRGLPHTEVFRESASTEHFASFSQASSFASSPSRDIVNSDIYQDRRFRRRAVYRREVCQGKEGLEWLSSSSSGIRSNSNTNGGDGAHLVEERRPTEPLLRTKRWKSTPVTRPPSVATSFIHTRKPMSASVEQLQGTVRVGSFIQRTRYMRLINHALVCHRRNRTGTVLWTEFVTDETSVRLAIGSAKVVLCFPEGRIVHLRFLSASTAAHWAEVMRSAGGGRDLSSSG